MITSLLVIFSAVFKAMMDSHAHHYHTSVWRKIYLVRGWKYFRGDSWKNKYIDDSPLNGRKKFFYGIFNVPVAFTDLWHGAQSLFLWTLFIALVFHQTSYYLFIELLWYRFIFGATFEFSYKHLSNTEP